MSEAFCRCGKRRYPSEREAEQAEPDGSFKCPECHTFARDHECSCDESSDFRCYYCDVRHGSHGGPDPFYRGDRPSLVDERLRAEGGI